MANQTKSEEKTADQEIEEQIAVFEPVAKSIKRKLKHPDSGEQREYVQHEMGFLTKLKFFKLLSRTLRKSAQTNGEISVADVVDELFNAGQGNPEVLFSGILGLVEESPEFITELYIYALGAKPVEEPWIEQALDTLSDEDGLDILDVFIGQNGEAMYDFFTKKLPRLGNRLTAIVGTEQDQSTTAS